MLAYDRQKITADGLPIGYPVSPFLLIPFARNELGIDNRRRRDFNYKISKARIVVEWAFGRLKSRFPALRKLGAVHDMSDIYRAIEAMMVLHNMCQSLGDLPYGESAEPDEDATDEEDMGLDENDEDECQAVEEEYPNLLAAGRAFRLRCLDVICPLS
jgi:hypothetical protein